MGESRHEFGRRGEDLALRYLIECGMSVVDRNWRCRVGEIDIIARDGQALVFFEVKTRRGVGFGAPLDAITAAKAARLRRLARTWLAASGGHRGPVRIDAIGILWPDGDRPVLTHVRSAC